MINIELKWHEFNVDLKSVETKMRNEQPSYLGNSAGANFVLYFEANSLTTQEQQDIRLWWKQDLTEAEEAIKRALPSRNVELAKSLIKAEKEAILLIEDLSTLSVLQKKIWMGLDLSDEELDSLAQ